MEELIVQYLLMNNECRIAGVGVLKVHHRSAHLDIVHKQMLPPKQEIIFDEDSDIHDNGIIPFIVSVRNISNSEAEKMFYSFCEEKKKKLAAGGSWEIPAVGFLQKNMDDHIAFVPFANNDFYQPVPAERVLHKNAEHSVRVGDKETTSAAMTEYYREDEEAGRKRWWIAAVILFTLAAGLLIYHFSNHPLNTSGIGNNTSIIPQETEATHQ
ncbi:hypothetical protein BH09BAC2_BH09BAC2_09420 [soil metagenome]